MCNLTTICEEIIMSDKKKKKKEMTEVILKKFIDPDNKYYDDLRKKNLARAGRTLASIDSRDRRKEIDEQIDLDERINDMVNKGKSHEDLEKEAEARYDRDRKLHGLRPRKKK